MKSTSNAVEAQDLRECWDLVQPVPGGRGRKARIRGLVFGGLTAREESGSDKHGRALWLCSCECGKTKLVTAYLLRQGRVKSCGCRLEAYRKAVKPSFGRAVPRVTFQIGDRYFDPPDVACSMERGAEQTMVKIIRTGKGKYRVPTSEYRHVTSGAFIFAWWCWTIARENPNAEPWTTHNTLWIENGRIKGSAVDAVAVFRIDHDDHNF